MTSEAVQAIEARVNDLEDQVEEMVAKRRPQYQWLTIMHRCLGLREALAILRGDDPDAVVELGQDEHAPHADWPQS